MDDTKYWVIVASKDHVERGRAGGFCQANHGKSSPLQRMRAGDWVVFYSPKITFQGKESCQAFTAIGKVKPGSVYQADMGGGFTPYRRDIAYIECSEAPIHPLIPQLSFIEDKQYWGYRFRFGFFEIGKEDFDLIADRMSTVE